MTGYADDLALAHLLADRADAISTARFRALDLRVEAKPDLTPVSDADTAVEREIRALLAERRPADGLLGEEYGAQPSADPNGRRWIIDPIDGTKNFVRGVPIWATLIALLDGDRPAVGVVSAPALGRRWWASAGAGAYAGPGPTARRAGSASPRVRGVRRRQLLLLVAERLGERRAARRGARPDPGQLAQPGVRRLLRLHAVGRGGAGRDGRAGAVAVGRGGAGADRHRGGWHGHRSGRTTGPAGAPGTDSSAVATNGVLHADILARLDRPAER